LLVCAKRRRPSRRPLSWFAARQRGGSGGRRAVGEWVRCGEGGGRRDGGGGSMRVTAVRGAVAVVVITNKNDGLRMGGQQRTTRTGPANDT
jgi:hypothetical protein